jgi:hypothetical protein
LLHINFEKYNRKRIKFIVIILRDKILVNTGQYWSK